MINSTEIGGKKITVFYEVINIIITIDNSVRKAPLFSRL
jgi:hypothetical protein